jgi:hypothetical protein
MRHSSHTPFFPAWASLLGPMKSKLATASLRRLTLSQLETRLGGFLPGWLLDKPAAGPHSRQRIYSLPRTFWGWLWQRLNGNASCREVVRQVQALCALQDGPEITEDTGGYCQARTQLPRPLLEKALAASAHTATGRAPALTLLQGRPLKVVDGSGLRLQDTPANQKAFPQPTSQKPGCGFPVMKLVVLFCLSSGALLARATGTLWDSERRLFQSLLSALQPDDIVIGDRGFGNFVLVALLSRIGVDLIARVSTNARRVDFRQGRRLGRHDRMVVWHKGPRQGNGWSLADWAALPALREVRIVRTQVRQKGFRSREITLVTTLLDAKLYPAQELLAAYARRWRLELCLDDLKTTLGLETLKCLSPAMVQKELLVALIAHNLLRCVMAEAAQTQAVTLERISFKGALDALRQFNYAMCQTRSTQRKQKMWAALLRAIARDLVPERPGRREPRAVKRRPKYDRLNRPRGQYRDRPRRSVRRSIAKKNRLI